MIQKKRILLLNYEFPPLGGGASPVSYELALRMAKSGMYDIDVVTMYYSGLSTYEEIHENLLIHRVWSLRSKKEISHPWEQFVFLVSALFKVRTLMKNNSYALCHVHFIIPTGILGYVLRKVYGLPYIVTAHGSDVLGYNARFKLLYKIVSPIWRRVIAEARCVVVPSRFLKSKIEEANGNRDAQLIHVIPHGIEISRFAPMNKKPIIFSSGRLFKNKGFQNIIQAVADKDMGFEVHIAGDGPMRGHLEDLAKTSKTKIVFHGWLDAKGEKYAELLGSASIFVSASEYESFGISIAEAMSAGCAVVASNTTGSAEVVGKSGILIPPSDISALRCAIASLIQNETLLKERQREALERAKEFDWDVIVREYAKIYD